MGEYSCKVIFQGVNWNDQGNALGGTFFFQTNEGDVVVAIKQNFFSVKNGIPTFFAMDLENGSFYKKIASLYFFYNDTLN